MTTSPTRTRLLHEYTAERIDLANAAAFVGSDYTSRPGYPTRERVARWNREWSAMVESERCPACGLCGEYSREWAGGGQLMQCAKDGGYVVQLSEGVKQVGGGE